MQGSFEFLVESGEQRTISWRAEATGLRFNFSSQEADEGCAIVALPLGCSVINDAVTAKPRALLIPHDAFAFELPDARQLFLTFTYDPESEGMYIYLIAKDQMVLNGCTVPAEFIDINFDQMDDKIVGIELLSPDFMLHFTD